MSRLTVRWIVGEWAKKPTHPQMADLFDVSVRCARAAFPDARFVITHNHLGPVMHAAVYAANVDAIIDVSEYPPFVDGMPRDERNGWWHFVPFRVAPDDHELVIDNDVVIWREPPSIREWRTTTDGLIVQGGPNGHPLGNRWIGYGRYTELVRAIDPELNICSGIIGLPPGLTRPSVWPDPARLRPWIFCTEQGWMAYWWLTHPGRRMLLPWDEVAIMNTARCTPDELVMSRCGAHFTEHNIGRKTTWGRYAATIRAAHVPRQNGHVPMTNILRETDDDANATDDRIKASIDVQPVAHVRWVHRSHVRANAWNPNHVAPIELDLLRRSIMANGWTQPIVVTGDTPPEIIDGYHRYLISGEPDIYDLTDGYLPVVIIRGADSPLALMAATVRHNRARGTHGVRPMSDIIIAWLDAGASPSTIAVEFGMELDEVERLRDRGNMVKRAAQPSFNLGWTPGRGDV
jgi:hypothetical protein